ncbi:SpoIID/LytB domain-containing protein [candidate division GN15 bacterium]|nr:SpoIID/LytB domain-containing protein [candidate division GN15 bacterium]
MKHRAHKPHNSAQRVRMMRRGDVRRPSQRLRAVAKKSRKTSRKMKKTPRQPSGRISLRRMSRLFVRISTGLMLLILLWSCGTVPGLHEEDVSGFIRIPFVRVLLEQTTRDVVLSSDASFAIECLSEGQQEVYYSGQPVTVRNEGLLTVYNHQGYPIAERLDEVNILPRGGGNRTQLGGKRYRGILRVLPRGEAVRVINVVYMEDYLRGVVPPELGKRERSEIEAVKAQAVAARTYAMAHLQQYGAEPYDIRSSIMDQLYGGYDVENKLVNEAINETTGRVVTHNDDLINAYYHSTSGGWTDNIEDVWERKEVPYLKAVNDGDASSWSKYFTWQEVFTEQQLRGRLEQYLTSDRGRDFRIGRITDIQAQERTAGGRVKKLIVMTDTDVYRFYKDRIRWVVGRTSNPDLILPSSNFNVTLKRDSQGNITQIVFSGRGYGHGVGMCQCGAIGHAREGWTFDQILTHYYTGVELKKLY